MKTFEITLLVLCKLVLSADAQICTIQTKPGITAFPPYNCVVTLLDYTVKMQEQIINFHNNVRRDADPPASNMQMMYWDDTLAKMAQKHAQSCEDAPDNKKFNGFPIIGQNLFESKTQPTALEPAEAWYSQVKNFTFGKETKSFVGHYTQIFQGESARLGCGGAYCSKNPLPYFIVCNYLKGQSDFIRPYTLGETCADCFLKCNDGLCDCGGKVCQNGGTLDLNSCKCKCGENVSGDVCETVSCANEENAHCKYLLMYCSQYFGFYVRNHCPKTCDVCE